MKILTTILTLACFSLVSCYPVAPMPNRTMQNPTKKELKEGRNVINNAVNKTDNKTELLIKEARENTAGAQNTINDATEEVREKAEEKVANAEKKVENKVAVGIKTAKKVPGRRGFVYNPYTNNQVDVREIPSGAIVRDPNDANKSNVFKVP